MKRNKELGRWQRSSLLAKVNGEWFHVDREIKSGYSSDDTPVFIGIGSGFDILRYLVWTSVGYGKKAHINNVDLGDVVEAVANKLRVEDDENLDVRIAQIPTNVVKAEEWKSITGDWKHANIYSPRRTLYGPKLPRDHKIDSPK